MTVIGFALLTLFSVCVLSCGRSSETSSPRPVFRWEEHLKDGTLSLIIVGDYFHQSFILELAHIARGLPARSRFVFFCTDKFKNALRPFLTANGVTNFEFHTFDKSAPILTQWARDVAVAGTRGGDKSLIVSPDKHATSKEAAEETAAILRRAFPQWRVDVTPFVFEGGNIAVVTSEGRRVLIAGRKIIFDNETYQRRPWAQGLDERSLLDAMRETFTVDTVIVVGRAKTRPPSRLYFEYHIDMGMAILGGNRAVVSRLAFRDEERASLAEALRAGHIVFTPFLSFSDGPEQLLDLLSARLSSVALEYEDYANLLEGLGVEVHRTPVAWQHVLASMSWTNVLQTSGRIIMPLYPDSTYGRTTSVTGGEGRMSLGLDLSLVDQERFELVGANAQAHDLYGALGNRAVTAPEYLHYFMGGIHCFVNVIE